MKWDQHTDVDLIGGFRVLAHTTYSEMEKLKRENDETSPFSIHNNSSNETILDPIWSIRENLNKRILILRKPGPRVHLWGS
jgi:hypothetical protein